MEFSTPEILLTNHHLRDFNPLLVGRMICESQHSYGPHIRDYTLLHYVFRGCGTFCRQDRAYTVRAGQCFLIQPGEVTVYTADKDEPWDYAWIGFTGEMQADFTALHEQPVFDAPGEIFREIIRVASNVRQTDNLEYFLAAQLFRLYYELYSNTGSYHQFVAKAKNYIDTTYMNDISIQSISQMLNMDRHYLSRIFKQDVGQTMQSYLLSVRLKKAAQLLRDNYTVSQAAQMVGYSDISNFSRKFKETYGVTPKNYSRHKVQPTAKQPLLSPHENGWSPKQWGR